MHPPGELRFLSNLGHVIEGLLLGSVAVVALTQAFGRLHTGRARYLWPGLLIAAGLFLPSLMLIHPTLAIMRAHATVILADPQQQQHLVMALLLHCGGVAEALAIRRMTPAWRIV